LRAHGFQGGRRDRAPGQRINSASATEGESPRASSALR